jgi:hypothetical protein
MFGEVEYYMHSIEFQKRGLPHVHCAFRVMGQDTITPEEVDEVISAEIPDEDDPMREAVLKHLIHGPCTTSRCLDKSTRKCSKDFPKVPTNITWQDNRGYWHYRKRMKNTVAMKRNFGDPRHVDDRWVVEHNKDLLRIFDCHINTQIASTVHIVKYLFKYIYKGNDFAKTGVTTDTEAVDEITDYQRNRYLSASDAHWRFSEFNICEREPKVDALSFHLPGQDMLIFQSNYLQSALTQMSQLTKYFQRPFDTTLDFRGNRTDYKFNELTYQQYNQDFMEYSTRVGDKNEHVVRHPTSKHYIRRRQNKRTKGCIARLYWV